MPRAYVVNQVIIHDAELYNAYKTQAHLTITKYGGTILAAGGRVETLEGEPVRPRVVIIEFPSYDAAVAYHNSPEYQAAAEFRKGAATVRFAVVEGVGETP